MQNLRIDKKGLAQREEASNRETDREVVGIEIPRGGSLECPRQERGQTGL